MIKRTLIGFVLLVTMMCAIALDGCTPRPTGISGTLLFHGNAAAQDFKLRIIELQAQDSPTKFTLFIEGQVVAEPTIGKDGTFQAELRPGSYVIKVFSAEDKLLTSHQAKVRQNKMTQVKIEME